MVTIESREQSNTQTEAKSLSPSNTTERSAVPVAVGIESRKNYVYFTGVAKGKSAVI